MADAPTPVLSDPLLAKEHARSLGSTVVESMPILPPRADDLPMFNVDHSSVTPCTHNPLGVKGAGEVGTIGGPPPVAMAALNALRPLGVSSLDIPLPPLRIWTAIQAAKSASEDAA